MQDGNKLAMAKDVRQALTYADRGETGGAFVYKTDALLATQAVILFEVPQELYKTRHLSDCPDCERCAANKEAKAFYDVSAGPGSCQAVCQIRFLAPPNKNGIVKSQTPENRLMKSDVL